MDNFQKSLKNDYELNELYLLSWLLCPSSLWVKLTEVNPENRSLSIENLRLQMFKGGVCVTFSGEPIKADCCQ